LQQRGPFLLRPRLKSWRFAADFMRREAHVPAGVKREAVVSHGTFSRDGQQDLAGPASEHAWVYIGDGMDIGIGIGVGATISISPFGVIIIDVSVVEKKGITVPTAAVMGMVKVISPMNGPVSKLTPAMAPGRNAFMAASLVTECAMESMFRTVTVAPGVT
jgi:hypothetical protein